MTDGIKRWLFLDDVEEALPEALVTLLPLAREPLSAWDEKTDLKDFLVVLNNKRATVVDESGVRLPTSYDSHGADQYTSGISIFNQEARNFTSSASSSQQLPVSQSETFHVPRFEEDADFGLAAKSIIAWDGIIDELLSRGEWFSLSHLEESQADLHCSMLLAQHFYYKQAMGILRNFVEDVVSPVLFCYRPTLFEQWKTNEFRLPSMLNKRKGVLKTLVDGGVLPGPLSKKIGNLYRQLNGFVHSGEKELINSGFHVGRWTGLVFDEHKFRDWCECVSQCVTLGSNILRINLDQWDKVKAARGMSEFLCLTCHNSKYFEKRPEKFGGLDLVSYTCKTCGESTTYLGTRPVWIVTHNPSASSGTTPGA